MEKLSPRMNTMSDKRGAVDLTKVLSDVYNRLSSVLFSTAGLAIATTTTAVKIGTAFSASVQGVLQSVAITDDAFVLSGTIPTATQNVFVFSMDKAGALFSQMGTGAATLAGVKWPNVPTTRTVLGYVVVANATGANFVGGTTALSAASITTTYVNTVGAFDPNAAIV